MVTLQSKVKRQLSCVEEQQVREKEREHINCRDSMDRSERTEIRTCLGPRNLTVATRQEPSRLHITGKIKSNREWKIIYTFMH